MPGGIDIKGRLYKDTVHGSKLGAVHEQLPISKTIDRVLGSDRIFNDLAVFIREYTLK